ncbi:hypothetical protein K7432_001896 [Basidiobolus ranarum]|uniref:Fibronectin type-III domain-containing protein n=1 Tax=Basidiobolus ranarum TaxID=34480 RepID=A0ABR2W9F9_9FUNG
MNTDELTSRTTWRRPGSSTYLKDPNLIDRLAASLDRHRAFSVIFVWTIMVFMDYCFNLPLEWLFFSYFTFTIFFNAFSISIAVFIVFFALILTTSGLTYYLASYQMTGFLASSVVNASLVHGFHGLDIIGWILVTGLSVVRYRLPWFSIIPPDFMAPIAAHCTSFGLLWILYHLAFFVHSSFDKVGLFFGLIIPTPPVIYIKNVKETGTSIYWTLPEKPSIERYLIEINGVIAGESDKQETSVEILGLSPNTWYKIRVWAVSNSRIRTSSQCIGIKTLPIVPTSISNLSNINKDSLSKSLEPKNTPVVSQKVLVNDENPQVSITEEKLEALRSECNIIKKQRQEIAQNAKEVEKQSQIEEVNIRNELDRLRALKRAEEEPKMKLKSRLKLLDDAKAEADAARIKLERELKLEQNAKQHAQDALQTKEREKDSLQKSTEAAKDKVKQIELEFNKEKEMLEESLSTFQNDITFAEKELEDAMTTKQNLWRKIVEKEEELEKLLNENGRITEPDSKLKNQKMSLDQEHRILFQNYLQLQELERSIKDQLLRLDHEKWTIMEELNKARRFNRLDNAYTGGYQLFGPTVGDNLPEISIAGQSVVSPPIFSTVASQPQSLFAGFSGGFTSSGVVGERRVGNNPLRNLAVNNNSAPDLLAMLNSASTSSGFNNHEADDVSNSTSFRPRHRYQSSQGSVHSLFEYGPVGSIDDPTEFTVISKPVPARSGTVTPEFDGSTATLFSTKHSNSPAGTVTPPSGLANGRGFRGREFNLFGHSSCNNETSSSRPQLPVGALEATGGSGEFLTSKKVSSNNLADRSASPVHVDNRSRNSSISSQRMPFTSRFEPFSGWSTKSENNK